MRRLGPVHYDYLALRVVAILQQKPSHRIRRRKRIAHKVDQICPQTVASGRPFRANGLIIEETTLARCRRNHQRNFVQRKTHITIGWPSGIPTRLSNQFIDCLAIKRLPTRVQPGAGTVQLGQTKRLYLIRLKYGATSGADRGHRCRQYLAGVNIVDGILRRPVILEVNRLLVRRFN